MYDANGDLVYGRLATDRTHQLGAQFLYSFAVRASVGVTQYVGSGTPDLDASAGSPSRELRSTPTAAAISARRRG